MSANSVDPDETPRSAVSLLGLHCLLRPACPSTYSEYGIYISLHTMKGNLTVELFCDKNASLAT